MANFLDFEEEEEEEKEEEQRFADGSKDKEIEGEGEGEEIDEGDDKTKNKNKKKDIITGRMQAKPNIGKPQPSELLQRLSAFLPKLRQANEELYKKDPKTYNIEEEDFDAEQVVEMVLLTRLRGFYF
jgi:hypothetical protein